MKTAAVPTAIGLSVTAIAVSWLTYCLLRKKRNAAQLTVDAAEWQHIGSIKEITLFPLKSGRAIEVSQANCNDDGLSAFGFRDRCLLLFTEEGRIAWGGMYPKMLSIRSEIVSHGLMCLTAPDTPTLTLDLTELLREGNIIEKPMKGYRLRLVECKAEHHVWFSKAVLQRESGLSLFISLEPIIETNWWGKPKHEVIPFLAIHLKSVEDLNLRLKAENQVHYAQFRGNVYIESLAHVKAFDEDEWMWLKIGDNPNETTILRYNSGRNCCCMVNIDVGTCKRSADFEPLKTLKKFRLRTHPVEPEMGAYFNVYNAGTIKKGHPVYVQYKKK